LTEYIHSKGLIGDFKPYKDWDSYKYILNLDGNTAAHLRGQITMMMGSILLVAE
jgi:hypothetical protein